MKKIYITGISGTGKTTISKELEKRGIYSISIDEIDNLCVWSNKKTGEKIYREVELNKDFIDTHDWICDVDMLKDLINKGKDKVVVLGVASNQKHFLDMFDKILLLQCKPETFISRILQRTDNDFGKDESAQESILGWYKKFEEEMINTGAVPVDVEKPLEEVVEKVIKEMNK